MTDKSKELEEFDRNRAEVRVYAVLHTRSGQWTTLETVAIRSGLSIADATSALWRMKNQEVLEWKWRGRPGVFRLPRKGQGPYRAELEYEARKLGLIEGPRMKPLFPVKQ